MYSIYEIEIDKINQSPNLKWCSTCIFS